MMSRLICLVTLLLCTIQDVRGERRFGAAGATGTTEFGLPRCSTWIMSHRAQGAPLGLWLVSICKVICVQASPLSDRCERGYLLQGGYPLWHGFVSFKQASFCASDLWTWSYQATLQACQWPCNNPYVRPYGNQ